MANNKVIMFRLAVSMRTKRDTLFQEGLRRLRHMDAKCMEEEIKGVMTEFSYSVMVSGYPDWTRLDIIKCLMERREIVKQEIRDITRVRFRSRREI